MTHLEPGRTTRLDRSCLAVLVGVAVVGLTACGAGPAAPTAAATASTTVQSCGREITFDTPPERVLAIGAEAPMLLAAAGAGDALTHYAGALDVPFGPAGPLVEKAEYLGESREVPVETIIGTGVDVVIGSSISAATDIDALSDRLAQAGIELFTVSGYCADVGDTSADAPSGFELIYRDIETYGEVFGTAPTASEAVDGLRLRVAAAAEQVLGRPAATATALFVTAEGPLGSYGNQALVSEQMALLGLDNVFGDQAKRYFEPNVEEIVNLDPDLVLALFVPGGDTMLTNEDEVVEALRGRPALAGLSAIADDSTLLPLNFYYTAPCPLAVDGLELLADRLSGG